MSKVTNTDIEGIRVVDDPRTVKNPGSMQGSGNVIDESVDREYVFCQGVVAEYISNPADFLNRERFDKKTKQSIGKIKDILSGESDILNADSIAENSEVARYMPHNSIMCYVSRGGGQLNANAKPIIAYPFFPQHFTLPLKPTERVWLIKEYVGNQINYYWMCRVVSDRQSDDLNFTAFDRNFHIRSLMSEFDATGPVSSEESVTPAVSFLASPNSPFPRNVNPDSMLASSVAFMEGFTGEVVPRKTRSKAGIIKYKKTNAWNYRHCGRKGKRKINSTV